MEVQTQYLSTIANIENVMDNSYYSNAEMKLLNKKAVSPTLKKKNDKVPMIIEEFGKETQKFIEQEFNNSKYVTSHKFSDDKSSANLKKKTPIESLSHIPFKFKRRSYLAEAISKEDLSDPSSFEYALKKITYTHVEKLVGIYILN